MIKHEKNFFRVNPRCNPRLSASILGFTLIEMMVVVSIILILSLISIPVYQGSKKQLALQRAVNKLAQDIRKAEEMAMLAKEFQGAVPQGGYGISLTTVTPGKYIVFADCNSNQMYDSSGTPCGNDTAPEKVEEIEIEKGIQIETLSPNSPLDTLDIVFTPPDPAIWVNSGTSTTGIITLKIDNSTTSVKVLPSGLIFIE